MLSLLSCSLSLNLLALWHYHFLSQSLQNLEHQIEQHRVEQYLMELRITNLQQQTTQWCPDAMSTSPTSRTPSLLSDIESEPHRRSFNNHEPPSNPSSHNISIHNSLFDQSKDRVSNPRTTNMGSRRNPIYILNDDEVRCEDVGRKDISLGIVTKNINMMWSNTSQLSGKRIWWNWHMLLTGTTINENTQDFKQGRSGPLQ